jgi:PAS domain S-box-containing protein
MADNRGRPKGKLNPPARRDDQSILQAFIATVPAGVMMTDRDMRILVASPQWLEAFGVTLEQAVGRTVYEISDYFEASRATYDRCLAGGVVEGRAFDSPGGGAPRHLSSHLSPWRDADGEIGGLLGTAIDITDMVKAQERSERSEQRFKLALELAGLHVWDVDLKTMTMTTEGAADTFFDTPPKLEDFLADTAMSIDPRDREAIAEDWKQAVLEDRPYKPEYRINRQDGREVWATGQIRMLRNSRGAPVRVIGALQNITDRKTDEAALRQAKDEAEAANSAKSVFLATMSHEIRTPLNGILGMAQAMENEPLPPAQRERLELIRESGRILLAILNDVLDLAKIEAGKLEVESRDFELGGLVRGVHDAFAATADGKGLVFNLNLEDDALGRYRSDPTRIRQVLYNLVSNAVKFTEAGRVGMTVSRRNGELTFAVTDSGPGMGADTQARLFGKFEQADASTTRRFGGTGLGLAISRELAGLLGGRIEADSRLGAGSTFRLVLPLERLGDETPAAAPVPTPTPRLPASERPLRVLAAEDNAINRLVLTTLLSQVGIEPVVVEDGEQALAAWREGDWDLVLMDVCMPRMDGPTAARAIRAEEAARGLAPIPIVALTANAMAHQVAEYRTAGMDGFVAKPIEAARLFEAVAAALAESGADDIAQAAER